MRLTQCVEEVNQALVDDGSNPSMYQEFQNVLYAMSTYEGNLQAAAFLAQVDPASAQKFRDAAALVLPGVRAYLQNKIDNA